jgi:hypothetical protein
MAIKFEDEKKRVRSAAVAPVDTSILNEDDIAALELQAEEEVLAEQREAAKKQKLAEFKSARKRKAGLTEAYEDVTVDLAPYCDRILLDNRAFMQGMTYTVATSQAQVMREIMQRTWGHQSEIDGKSENFYRKQRGVKILPNGGVTNILRA